MRVQKQAQVRRGPDTNSTIVVDVAYLLDRSGSMIGAKYQAAVKGIKDDIAALRSLTEVEYTLTVIEFDSTSHRTPRLVEHLFMVPLERVPENPFVERGASGGTPLFYATGHTIEKLIKFKPQDNKCLLNIFTDGGETDFNEPYTHPSVIKALINKVEKDNNFTITFQGTEQDINFVVNHMGVHASNTFAHQNTGASILYAAQTRTSALRSYSKAVASGQSVEEGFYTKTVEEDKNSNATITNKP